MYLSRMKDKKLPLNIFYLNSVDFLLRAMFSFLIFHDVLITHDKVYTDEHNEWMIFVYRFGIKLFFSSGKYGEETKRKREFVVRIDQSNRCFLSSWNKKEKQKNVTEFPPPDNRKGFQHSRFFTYFLCVRRKGLQISYFTSCFFSFLQFFPLVVFSLYSLFLLFVVC